MAVKIILLLCLLTLAIQTNSLQCEVQGCVSCPTANKCEVCSDDYTLQKIEGSEENTCVREVCPQNCDSCNSQNECQSCSEGFLLTETGTCTFERSQISVEQTSRLLQGNNTNGTCSMPNCRLCYNPESCMNCNVGYQLTPTGKCMPCNVGSCQYCSTANVCAACNQSIPLLAPSPNGGACFLCDRNRPNMAGCVACNGTHSCGQCANGLQLFTFEGGVGVCLSCSINNCLACGREATNSTTTICRECNKGYSLSSSRLSCILCAHPCVTCTQAAGPSNCATCAVPEHYSTALQNGTCVKKLIPGCLIPDTNNATKCLACETGFILSNDTTKCNWNCSQNCQACTNATTCTTCVRGFSISATGTCAKCAVQGCADCAADILLCTTCLKGFYKENNECKVCPGFCLACSSYTTCTELAIVNNQVLMTINGQVVLAVCDGNCLTCSDSNPQNCIVCKDGHFLANGKCKRCSGSCLTCDSTNATFCLTCFPNTFLSSGACVGCNSTCKTCEGASNVNICTSCWDGYYLSENTCVKGCPKNCFACSNLTTCTQCRSGFTTFLSNTSSEIGCAPCITSCRTCSQGKPASCLTCGQGLYLLGSVCKPCSTNCKSCTSSGCTECSSGFFMTSLQTCAANCIVPCSTCSTTDPTSCLGCVAGYSFNDITKACDPVTSCSDGCVVCPLGYSLNNGECLQCPTANCSSCNVENSTECYTCKPTFYLNTSGVCASCPSQCKTCLTGDGCQTCATGYTIKENAVATANGYECVKCESPCLTCANTPNYCTSCVEGYKFFGWKCAQAFRFTFAFSFSVTLEQFYLNYMVLLAQLAGGIGSTDSNAITFDNIVEGSVNLDGSAAPSGAPGSSEAANQLSSLSSLVSSGSLAGMVVGSSSIVVAEGTVGSVTTNNGSDTPVLAIVLGVCIPVTVIIIVGIIVYIFYKKKQVVKIGEQVDQDSSHKVIA